MTYTYAILRISRAAFDEVTAKLREAGSTHRFDQQLSGGETVIDMHGLALAVKSESGSRE